MKSRLLIIIGIVLASVVLVSSAYVISVQSKCKSLLGDTHYPRPLTLWNCLNYLNMVDNPPPKSITESIQKWKIPEELEKMGCTDAMIIHLKKYSNAFDEKWNGKGVAIEDIGLPWGVHQYALDECMQNISELRNNEN